MGGRDVVSPARLPEVYQGRAAHRDQRDPRVPPGQARASWWAAAAGTGGSRMSAETTAMRLAPQPGEVIDRTRPVDHLARLRGEVIDRPGSVEFSWNGRPVTGFAGDTIVSALAASGARVFSRSMKYHRPRGLLTASFHDPGCMVQVHDEPNVRGAH